MNVGLHLAAMAPASREAAQIAEVVGVLIAGGALLFLLAMLLLALALRREKRELAPAVWIFGLGLALPAVVLALLMAYAAIRSKALAAPPPADALLIGITGRLWWWELRYEGFTTANELRLPAGRAVRLSLSSDDVIHSFWVPPLGGKMDLVPGRLNHLNITAPEPGSYSGPCAEFCGQQHARMALKVIVMEPADFERWLQQQARPAAREGVEHGRRLFLEHGCASCHTVRETEGATGPRLGPDLTHLASRQQLGAGVLPNDAANLRRWIADVQAHKPGARMPSYAQLDAASLDALTAYLSAPP